MAMTRWLLTLLLLLPVMAWGQTTSQGVRKTGTTAAGQVPFFASGTTVTTDTALTWNNTLKTLALGTGTSVTITAATLTAARTFTLPDANSNPVIPKDCNALVTGEVVKSISALGVLGCMAPTMTVRGATSGVISVLGQAAAGTYNFNLPITAGTAGQALLSGGGGSAPMTWGAGSGGGGCGTTGTIGQIMVFTGTSTCAGATDFTWDGSIFTVGNGLYQAIVSATLTTNRTVNLPDADSTTVVAKDCNALVAGQVVKSVSAAGVVGCMAPSGSTVKVWLPVARCHNATPTAIWDLPVTTPAVATCITGTNTQKGVLAFADSGPFIAQTTELLPADWTTVGGIDARIVWASAATSGNIKWYLSTGCAGTAATMTDDQAFNTANSGTTASPGTTLWVQTTSITALTLTGCTTATSMLLHLKILRDGTDAADTIAATANLIGIELTYRRAS